MDAPVCAFDWKDRRGQRRPHDRPNHEWIHRQPSVGGARGLLSCWLLRFLLFRLSAGSKRKQNENGDCRGDRQPRKMGLCAENSILLFTIMVFIRSRACIGTGGTAVGFSL